ncbi:ZrgA family zinc uptake protein [Marinobacter apostichopi]|uniref:ZrgA family zinc uptake protein n=1 Tax=Marinobacter apostichopi TaxID=3035454 RepID=UPI0025738FB1|nr:DUF2796 domain-containing protein [Marinobacter sp. LA51]
MLSTTTRLLPLPVLLLSALTASAENLNAHQHGQAELQLAMDGQLVELMALSPAHNLLGFEHEPRTEAEQEAVESALTWLTETPLINTVSGSCSIQTSEVHYAFAGDDGDDAHHEEHGDHEHEHHESGEVTHTDIEAFQTLICPDLAHDSQLVTSLSEQFPAIEDLDIEWAGPEGQGALRLEQGITEFSLKP